MALVHEREWRRAVGSDDMFVLADELIRLKELKEDLATKTTENNRAIDALEQSIANELMQSGTDGFRRGGRTFFYTTKVFVRPNKAREDDLFDWLANNGYEHMVKASVNTNTLRAAVKEMIEANDGDLPDHLDDLVVVTEIPTIGVRKV